MDPKELTSILTKGLAVVRKLEADCHAMLPPVERENPAMLREIRELESIAIRLELELDIEAVTALDTRIGEESISNSFDHTDVQFLREEAGGVTATAKHGCGGLSAEPREALLKLADLLDRCIAEEFS
jgi:hypothetical protein